MFWPLLVVCVGSLLANAFLLLSGGRETSDFVPYRPVYFDVTATDPLYAYKVNRAIMSDAHVEKVRLVLEHYDLEHRVEQGRLMIRRELWEDRDRMAEITTKARDWDWLTNVAGYSVDRRATVVREGPTFDEMRERLEELKRSSVN